MKKIYILLTLLFCVTISHAQYHPMPTKDAVWSVYFSYPIFTGKFMLFGTTGDTLINAKNYVKIESNKVDTDFFSFSNPNNHYEGAFREEDKKIYFIKDGSLSEELMYDFNLTIGDDLPYDYTGECINKVPVLEQIESISLELDQHDRYTFEDVVHCSSGGYYKEEWITGVGSTKGFLFPSLYHKQLLDLTYNDVRLICMEVEGNIIFSSISNPELCFQKINTKQSIFPVVYISPNPFLDKLYIDGVENITSLKLYSQLGQQIEVEVIKNRNRLEINTTNLSNGVYYLQVEDVFNQQKMVKCIKL
jgi:hypothetical protein